MDQMKNGVVIDALTHTAGGPVAHGSFAQALLAGGMKINALRTLGTLQKEEWIVLDEAIVKAARTRLIGVADLQSRGLTKDLSNGLGTTVLEYEDLGSMEGAEVSMDGITKGREDRMEYGLKYLPLPITHKGYKFGIRALAASRNRGDALDTTHAEESARKVAECAENMLFNGYNGFAFGGGTIYGYCDFPQRITKVLSKAWTSATGAEILADVIAMKALSIAKKQYGPWTIYIPTAYETVLDNDFKAETDKPLRVRLLELAGIEGIKVADHLPANNVIMAQMQSNTVRWINGMPLTNVEWQTEGNMMFHFRVMQIGVPQIRADQDGNCGVVHAATA
jgi:uncharacterized linocin/CFP29 family protein